MDKSDLRLLIAKKIFIQSSCALSAKDFKQMLDDNNVWYEHGVDSKYGDWFKIFGQTKEFVYPIKQVFK